MLAVLDANVLYPFQLRNLLLHLATQDLFQPLWSEPILEEARRNLQCRGVLTDEQWKRLQGKMREAFPEAWGFEFERLVPALTLPDPNDRHVLALAIHYEADVIVTLNSKDFPLAVLHPLGLTRLRPPSFVDRLWRTDPDAVLSAAEQHRLSLSKSALSPNEYLDALRERAGLRQLAARLAARGFLDR